MRAPTFLSRVVFSALSIGFYYFFTVGRGRKEFLTDPLIDPLVEPLNLLLYPLLVKRYAVLDGLCTLVSVFIVL